MRTRLLEHLLADPGRGGPARLGRLLQRFSGELQAVRAWPGRGLPRLLSEGVLVLACAAAAVLALPDLVRGLSVASLVLLAGGLFGDGGPSPGVLAASLALLAALVPTLRELARRGATTPPAARGSPVSSARPASCP